MSGTPLILWSSDRGRTLRGAPRRFSLDSASGFPVRVPPALDSHRPAPLDKVRAGSLRGSPSLPRPARFSARSAWPSSRSVLIRRAFARFRREVCSETPSSDASDFAVSTAVVAVDRRSPPWPSSTPRSSASCSNVSAHASSWRRLPQHRRLRHLTEVRGVADLRPHVVEAVADLPPPLRCALARNFRRARRKFEVGAPALLPRPEQLPTPRLDQPQRLLELEPVTVEQPSGATGSVGVEQ